MSGSMPGWRRRRDPVVHGISDATSPVMDYDPTDDADEVAEAARPEATDSGLGLLLAQNTALPKPDVSKLQEVFGSSANSRRQITVGPGIVQLRTQIGAGRKGGGTRGAISGFSRKSRGGLMRRIAMLDWSVVEGVPAMVTLTYPGDWRSVCPDGPTVKRHLGAFIRRWEREWGSFRGVWKLEFQPRRKQPEQFRYAPHLHLYGGRPLVVERNGRREIITHAVFRSWVSKAWFEVVGSGDERHFRAGTGVDERVGSGASDVARIASYFAGYSVKGRKDDQHVVPIDFPNVGRFWGVRGLSSMAMTVQLDEGQFFQLHRILRTLRAK
jgi:hypothetical protein